MVVEDVRFLHPDNSLILRVQRARSTFDLGVALRGELGFDHAQVDGGYLLVAARPSGRTGLEEAFDDGQPSQRPDDYLRMRLRRIHVEHLAAEFRPSADHPFRLRNVHGELEIEHRDTKGAHVRLQHIAGEMTEPSFLGERLAIRSATGWVHGAEVHVLDLNLETHLGSGDLGGHLAYDDRKKTPVELDLDPKGRNAETRLHRHRRAVVVHGYDRRPRARLTRLAGFESKRRRGATIRRSPTAVAENLWGSGHRRRAAQRRGGMRGCYSGTGTGLHDTRYGCDC